VARSGFDGESTFTGFVLSGAALDKLFCEDILEHPAAASNTIHPIQNRHNFFVIAILNPVYFVA